MKYYLVPSGELGAAEEMVSRVSAEESAAWDKIVDSFADGPQKHAAASYANVLKLMPSVSLRNGLVLIKHDKKSAIGAMHLIKSLSDISTATHRDVKVFLKLLSEAESPSVPEARKNKSNI